MVLLRKPRSGMLQRSLERTLSGWSFDISSDGKYPVKNLWVAEVVVGKNKRRYDTCDRCSGG